MWVDKKVVPMAPQMAARSAARLADYSAGQRVVPSAGQRVEQWARCWAASSVEKKVGCWAVYWAGS